MATKKKNLKKSAKTTGTATAGAQAQPGQTAPQPDPNALSIGDLKNLSTILDVASTRGAFKANEMEAVGKTYNKLDSFLQQVQKAEEEAKKADEGATEAKGGK